MNYNELANEIHTYNVNVGWWDGEACIYEKLQLVSTEIAEATEGERKNLMDDHLPHRKMGEVELADALIRVLDIGGRVGSKYLPYVSEHHRFVHKDSTIGKQHLGITLALASYARNLDGIKTQSGYFYTKLINSIVHCADINGYDIEAAMIEKIEYNKHRADHKRENRAAAGGKAF